MGLFKSNILFFFFSLFVVFLAFCYIGCNRHPRAEIDAPTHAIVNTDVQLDGSESNDPDGDYLHYQWGVSVQPDPVPPDDPVFSSTSEIARLHPTKVGNYIVSLRVEDNDAAQDFATATIIVVEDAIISAIAKINPDSVDIPNSFYLYGADSYHAEDSDLEYEWRILEKPGLSNAEINRPDNENTSLRPDEPGTYIIELKASAEEDFDMDTVIARVNPPRITSVYPSSGKPGDTIKIDTKNMSYKIEGNIVRFNTTLAEIISIDSLLSEIVVTVPIGAATGLITVEIAETEEIATSPEEFEVTQSNGDFSLSIENTIGIYEGRTNTYKYIGVTREGNHNDNITLSIKNKPDSVSFTFNPNPVPYDVYAVEMIMNAEYEAVPGEHQTTVVANDNSVEKEFPFNLEVLNQYTLSTNPENISIAQDTSAIVDVDINWAHSEVYSEMIFTIEGSIIGIGDNAVEATFDPNPLPWGTFSNELTLEVGVNVAPGTYPLTIKGATPNLEKSTVLELTVESP